ncbi:hypothetical protein OF122_05490 [Pelagibacterium flavum]|uniref:SnoaL-like domain-containing protein n=1 Tax=Pelagibacterium flavum TaxID=2984530 RepID=A0ABY6IRG5_9HYPH|nr:hypothetical protein [Pelagibacterium sp. YIM 151497]MAN77563.1 hypothetical protein [Hyphomicrobiales bacterium]UYQ73217.1 hypothetical protein OF122_05490 [Pelagibacterium sp. YIM 151497]|eukprot:jgi/Tetstr1/451432/TSEL_038468.t1
MDLYALNPFSGDPDRRAIWEMLVARDIEAFLACDWSMVEPDFAADRFMGIDGKASANPDDWRISFPTLEAYRDSWLAGARDFAPRAEIATARAGVFGATQLTDIEITGDRALAHKKFNGRVEMKDGSFDVLDWQSVYTLARIGGIWKLTGFIGYLPYQMGQTGD